LDGGSNVLQAKVGTREGWPAATEICNEGGRWCRGWHYSGYVGTISGKELFPSQLACLQDSEQVGERQSETVAEEAHFGCDVVEDFRHGVVGVVDVTRRCVRCGADSGDWEQCGE
jgi:hypothetical protein